MSSNNTNIQGVFNMTLSGKGPKALPISVDMTLAKTFEVDLSAQVQNGNIDFISGAWIDNSENENELEIIVAGTNQRVAIGSKVQGYLPLLSPNNPKFEFSCAVIPGIIIPIIFYNIPLLPFLYNKSGGNAVTGDFLTDAELRATPVEVTGDFSSDGLTDAELRATPVPVTFSPSVAPALIEYEITLDGIDGVLSNAGETDNYFMVYNPVGNDTIKVNLAGNSASDTGIEVSAGGSIEIASGISNDTNVVGTDTQTVIVYGR
jgi:hypothetical protein